MKPAERAQYLHTDKLISSQVAELYMRQKVVLMQKHRDNMKAMLEINDILKSLKEDHQRVVHELRTSHLSETKELRSEHS